MTTDWPRTSYTAAPRSSGSVRVPTNSTFNDTYSQHESGLYHASLFFGARDHRYSTTRSTSSSVRMVFQAGM